MPNHSNGYLYIYKIIDPSQEPSPSIEGNIMDMPNISTTNNESYVTHAEINISQLSQLNKNGQTKISSKLKGKVTEINKQFIRSSPIKRKRINYKECHSPSKKAKKCTRSSPIKRKPVNYKECSNRSPSKKTKKAGQLNIPRYHMDQFDDTENQSNIQEQGNEIPRINDSFSDTDKIILIRQQKHMALVEGDNFNDLENNPLLEESKKMHKELESIELQPACIVCKERWYDTPISKIKKMCQRCLNESQKVKPNKKGEKY